MQLDIFLFPIALFIHHAIIANMIDILLCNDDGIHAPGIYELHQSLQPIASIDLIAPDAERSAAGHAITLTDPLKVMPIEKNDQPFGLAVSGTPADCIKLSLCHLRKTNPPDLVVSGINLGSNTGISVLYSGTVSAASEAVILGIPGIAISLCTYHNPPWETAAHVAREIIKKQKKDPLPPGVLLNVNVPNVPLNELKGFQVARMGRSRFVERFSTHQDPRGNTYYWLDGDLELLDDRPNTDVHVVEAGFASLTPIHIDLTAESAIEQLTHWNKTF